MTTQDNRLSAFLRDETERNRKRAQRWRFFGIPVVIIYALVMLYYGYRLNNETLDPYHLSAVVATKINDDAPRIINEVEKDLIDQAPVVMAQLNLEVFAMLPYLERVAEKQIDVFIDLIPELDSYSYMVLDKFYDKHGNDLGEFLKAHENEEEIAHLIDEVYIGMINQIDRKFEVTYGGQSVRGARELSLVHLNQLNTYFTKLANVHPFRMTPSERLQRRLIVAWSKTFRKLLKLEEA